MRLIYPQGLLSCYGQLLIWPCEAEPALLLLSTHYSNQTASQN